jgi:hypothetical protein
LPDILQDIMTEQQLPYESLQDAPPEVKLAVLNRLKNMKPEDVKMQLTDFTKYQDDPIGFCETFFKETYTDDVKRLMLSVRDNPVTVAISANATGKTHAAARVAVWWYCCYPESQCYTAAAPPEGNLKKLLWGEIGSLTEEHRAVFKESSFKSLHVERTPQQFLTGVTIPMSGTDAEREAKFSGKHSPNLLFLVDEGDAVPDSVFRGIDSCMSGGNARLLIMFNPRQEAGSAYRMIRDGMANVVSLSAFNHPNVTSGEDVIPGAVTRDTVVRRINDWCRPLNPDETPDSDCFKLPEFLEGVVGKSLAGKNYEPLKPGSYKIMESAFSYMVLGKYPSQGSDQLIARQWVDAARRRWDNYVKERGEDAITKNVAGIQGQDIAEFGDDANCACFRYDNFVSRLVTWSGLDLSFTTDRAVEEYQKRNIRQCMVDGTGVGAGISPAMCRKGCHAYSIKVASSPTWSTELGDFKIIRDQLWWSVREWLRTEPAMLPPDEWLLEELLVPTYDTKTGKVKVMRKDIMKECLKRSPDRADALCLTFYEHNKLFPYLGDDKPIIGEVVRD